MLRIKISVEPKEATTKEEIEYQYEEVGAHINIFVDLSLTDRQVDVYSGGEYIFSPYVGKHGIIKVRKKSGLGKRIIKALISKELRILA